MSKPVSMNLITFLRKSRSVTSSVKTKSIRLAQLIAGGTVDCTIVSTP